MRIKNRLSKIALFGVLLCGLLMSFSHAAMAAGQVTDEAFAALLSMPSAKPQSGQWIFDIPSGFEPSSEENLIRWLAKKKKQGADFNAQRHFGTLLDHALRSHLKRTALWLIDNGAISSRGGSSVAEQYGDKKAAAVLREREALVHREPALPVVIPSVASEPDLEPIVPIILDEKRVRPLPSDKPRFVPAQLDCQISFNEVWYQALLNIRLKYDQVGYNFNGLRFISVPEQKNCAMLVNMQQVDERKGREQDSFDGPYMEGYSYSCTTSSSGEIWLTQDNKIVTLFSDSLSYDLQPLRDNADGHLYYLRWADDTACANTNSDVILMDWQRVNSHWVLKKLAEQHPVYRAFVQQCVPQNEAVEKCLAINPPILSDEARAKFLRENPYSLQTPIELINRYKAAEHLAYLAAIAELDKPKLRVLQAQGIPPQWTAEALQALNKSTLSLANKRQRTAWIFRDHKQLTALFNSTDSIGIPEGLVDWLPREDWRPLLQVLEELNRDDIFLRMLAYKARAKGLNNLACDVDHARSLMCGETWSVDNNDQGNDGAPAK